MSLKILVKGQNGATVALTPKQLQTANPVIVDMMNGKFSVRLANDLIIQKLKDAGDPVVFEETAPCNTEAG